MKDNFANALTALLIHEAGFVDNKDDPGGMTNLGVTAATWAMWVGHDVNEKQMRALTPSIVAPLYRRKFWDACRADELISGLDYAIFDFAVNSGVGRSIKTLQACVGVNADGGFGSTTMAAVSLFKGDSAKVIITEVCDNRLNFLKSLKTFAVFGKGWENRVNSVKAQSLKMLG